MGKFRQRSLFLPMALGLKPMHLTPTSAFHVIPEKKNTSVLIKNVGYFDCFKNTTNEQ